MVRSGLARPVSEMSHQLLFSRFRRFLIFYRCLLYSFWWFATKKTFEMTPFVVGWLPEFTTKIWKQFVWLREILFPSLGFSTLNFLHNHTVLKIDFQIIFTVKMSNNSPQKFSLFLIEIQFFSLFNYYLHSLSTGI